MKRTLLALTLLAAPAAALAVPAQLTTQGRVLDADAAPVDDTVAVTFRLMDSESGGTTLWEETQSVAFTNGFYSVMLGTDEEANPLEDSVLDQWPLYLEVQLDGEGPMFPRMSVGSVPYARQAGIAEELAAGADIDAGSLTVNGTEVVTADGAWTGATPDVDWSDLTGIPGDFADEDDADTLAGLVCSDGQWAVWDDDSAAWGCDGFSDTTLLDADVVVAVGTDVVDLYAGSTMDGYTLLTEDSELAWANLTGIPSGLDDGDDDTLGGLSCAGSQVAAWDAGTLSWACATDDTLSYSEVAMAVEAASTLSLPAATDVGGSPVITTSDTVDWSQLTAVPTGLADGDDDTLAATSCADGEVMVYSTTSGSWGCGTDTDTTLTVPQVQAAVESIVGIALAAGAMVDGDAVLTETSVVDWSQLDSVPSGLEDGDDDTLAGLGCADGEVATYDSSTGWGCASGSSSSVGTVIYGDYEINNNLDIALISGVTEITGDLTVGENVTTLVGLESLISIGGRLLIANNRLITNLDGLDSLESVGEEVELRDLAVLTEVDALSSLTNIGGALLVTTNVLLTSVTGLGSTLNVGGQALVQNNSSLCQTDVDALFARISSAVSSSSFNDNSC
mgnify:CR=1 FL=1